MSVCVVCMHVTTRLFISPIIVFFFLLFTLQTYWFTVYYQIAYFYYSNENNFGGSKENNMDVKSPTLKVSVCVCVTGNEAIWQNIRN